MITTRVPSRGTQPLAGDLANALDPVLFARTAGIEPDAWQADVLRSGHRRILLNCSRQSGKSTVAAIIALHRAIYHPRSLVLLISPSLRQSGELFRTVSRLHGRIAPTPPKEASALKLELGNGSRVISLPGSEQTIRGFSGVDLLVLDEAARVDDDLYGSVRPMLATTDGRLIAMWTPFGKRGWWSDAWHDGGTAWHRVRITAEDLPRISRTFLADERAAMGSFWFMQEYLCEFSDADSSAFRSVDIEHATGGEEVETWTL